MHSPNIKIHSVHPPSFCRGGGLSPQPNFQKGGLEKTSTFRGCCWERGGDFFPGEGLQFSHKNKLKSEIFNDKKSWSACIVCRFKRGAWQEIGGSVFEGVGGGGGWYPNAHYEMYQYLIIYIILFFCLHQSDLLNWVYRE